MYEYSHLQPISQFQTPNSTHAYITKIENFQYSHNHPIFSSAGFNVFSIHCTPNGGVTLATIFPLINPMGKGPNVLESLDHGKLSPTT
jgi:hypothetical protein